MLQPLTLNLNDESERSRDSAYSLSHDHEPSLVHAISPLLCASPRATSTKPRTTKALSDIFDNKKAKRLADLAKQEMKHKSAFPENQHYSGYLSIRMDGDQQWHRKYLVLSNNFLFGGDTQYSTKLSLCLPLQSSNTKLAVQSTDMTFEIKPYSFRAHSPQICSEWIEHIERASTLTIYDIYRFRYELGSSSSSNSKVIAAKHRISNQDFAIKILNKKKHRDKQMLTREIQILKKLKSPYIVELCDLFETNKYLYIVMEFCDGGELFDQIANMDYLNGDRYTEQDIINIMHQLASGVQYMHDMGIVHRDLKPENILCVEPNSIKQIKIADFGISAMMHPQRLRDRATESKTPRANKKHYFPDSTPTTRLSQSHSNASMASSNDGLMLRNNESVNSMMKTRVGTLSYTAPEILKYKPYDERVDYWSLGVIMYILVCGYPPFDGDNDYDLSDEIIHEQVEFDEEDWTHVGDETRELIQRLLDKNPRRRANCVDIIEHSWKIDVKTASFQKAHNKFKQTVFKRKVQTKTRSNTVAVDSMLSLHSNADASMQSLHARMASLMENRITSLDDSVIKSKASTRMNVVQFDSDHKEAQIEAWNVGHNKHQSKTTEFLYLEHLSPINPRDSIFFTEHLVQLTNTMDDLPEFPSFDLMSYSNRSASRKGTNVTDVTNGSSPTPGQHVQHYHGYSNGSRLSLLSSQSFLESFTNKRSSVSKYKRSNKRARNRTYTRSSRKSSRRKSSQQRYGNRLVVGNKSNLVLNQFSGHSSSNSAESWCDQNTVDEGNEDEEDEKSAVFDGGSYYQSEAKTRENLRRRKVTFPDEQPVPLTQPTVFSIQLGKMTSSDTVEYHEDDQEEDAKMDALPPIPQSSNVPETAPEFEPTWNASDSAHELNVRDNGMGILALQTLAVGDSAKTKMNGAWSGDGSLFINTDIV